MDCDDMFSELAGTDDNLSEPDETSIGFRRLHLFASSTLD